MKKTLKIIAILVVIAIVAIQFVRPDRTNPPVDQAQILEATTAVPADVKEILVRSCSDCHSNETRYPWYSNVSPFSWFLVDHIREGRGELNLSEWGTYTTEKKKRKLDEICEMVQSAEMPLPSYLWIHRDAVLSESDKKVLCDWSEEASNAIGN